MILLFGIVQVLILLRIVFLLLGRPRGPTTSSDFGPQREPDLRGSVRGHAEHANALQAGGSVLDVAAILALIGWTLLEALILAAVGVFRREAGVTDLSPTKLGGVPQGAAVLIGRSRQRPEPA